MITTQLKAHDPGQITYRFEQIEQSGKLVIHLTPKGAVDLIQTIKPDLQSQSIINPTEHTNDYTQYFNQKIRLNINGQHVKLKFLKADLLKHDATMEFTLTNFPGTLDNFQLSLNSFTDIYPRVVNYVQIPLEKGYRQFILDKNTTNCSSDTESTHINHPTLKVSQTDLWMWGLGLPLCLVIVLGTVGFFYDRKIHKKTQKRYFI